MQAAAEREETAVHRFTGGQRAYLAVKSGLDRCLGLVGLVLCSPILLVVALLIKREGGGPVLFKQPRIGYRGKVFDIYKFRSMRVGAEHTGSGVYSGKDDQRVTRIGRVLRATSLDELPQFLNLLKGECSLIGPRAPLTYHPWPWEEYDPVQRQMFLVRPGITGWAQVNGRKSVEWHRRVEMNVWYVHHVSPLLDLRILLATVFKVLSNADNVNTGATAPGDAAPTGADREERG